MRRRASKTLGSTKKCVTRLLLHNITKQQASNTTTSSGMQFTATARPSLTDCCGKRWKTNQSPAHDLSGNGGANVEDRGLDDSSHQAEPAIHDQARKRVQDCHAHCYNMKMQRLFIKTHNGQGISLSYSQSSCITADTDLHRLNFVLIKSAGT